MLGWYTYRERNCRKIERLQEIEKLDVPSVSAWELYSCGGGTLLTHIMAV